MIGLTLLLFVIGLSLSAFFSGSETGFYRVTRVRLVLDALDGDMIARSLLWLTNNPALFVATALVGNNVANYLTSLAIVLSVERLWHTETYLVELAATVALAPLVFVYGELLPKSLFYRAPNRLLRRGGPFFLFCAVVFSPIAAVLGALGRLLQWLVGEAPLRVHLTLARKELQQVLREGLEAGVLQPAQRHLAEKLFGVANQRVGQVAVPAARVPTVRRGARTSDVLRLARRHGQPAIPVAEPRGHDPVGYVRVVDLSFDGQQTVDEFRPLITFRESDSYLSALSRMQSGRHELARVVDADGRTTGLLYLNALVAPLFRASGASGSAS